MSQTNQEIFFCFLVVFVFEKIFNAFGLDRCMWGTDWTRAVDLLTYEQGVEAFRVTDALSESEKSTLMGGSLTKIYGWEPSN